MRCLLKTTSQRCGSALGVLGQLTPSRVRAAATLCWARLDFMRFCVRADQARRGTTPLETSSTPWLLRSTPPLRKNLQDSSPHILGCDPQTFLLARPAFRGASRLWMWGYVVLLLLAQGPIALSPCDRGKQPASNHSPMNWRGAALSTSPSCLAASVGHMPMRRNSYRTSRGESPGGVAPRLP